MSDILSSYFSLNSRKRDYKLDLKDTPNLNLNKKYYDHGLKFSGNSKTLKLPKLKIMSQLITERNKSSEGFKVNNKNDISTPTPKPNHKHLSMRYKKTEGHKKVLNNIFKNKLLSGLNNSTRSYTKNNYSSSPISKTLFIIIYDLINYDKVLKIKKIIFIFLKIKLKMRKIII